MTEFLLSLAAGPSLSLATRPLFGLPLADLWFVVVMALLGAFLFLDGFDFGIGALFATRSDEHDRETLLAAIGPFWDGNEVWLVVFGGSLFAVFPRAYASLFGRYYLLMFAILAALVVRGLAPEMYEQRDDDAWTAAWGVAFVAGSVGAPFFLGVFAGNWVVGAPGLVSVAGLLFGVALVALSIVEGAAFLGLKTRGALREELTRYGTRAAVAYLVLAVVAVGYLATRSADLRGGVRSVPGLLAVALTAAATVGYVLATRRKRYHVAFVAAAGAAFALVALVGTLLYPYVDPATGLTVRAAAVAPLSLNLVSVAAALLVPLVLVYFGVLYSVFAGQIEAGEGY
ncbi:MAG: cytochrome d ubiquinol oxidase subunit II [Haloarculaceae archaeon]